MGDLGYGTDFVGSNDLTESMDEIADPFSPQAIAQDVYKRLDCPLGGLIDDELYGHDVRQHLNRGTTDAALASAASEIRGQVELDDRIASATVTVTPGGTPIGRELTISIRILPVDPTRGVFTMTLLVTSAAVLLQEITA